MAKIKYGISEVYYAVATPASNGSMTYGTPVALPGATSISLDSSGENTTFYADNIAYWVGNGNNGYSGSLELAMIPDSFKENVLGQIKDGKNVLVEDLNAAIVHFALLFKFNTDANGKKVVMYNCTCSRPSEAGTTKGENIEPQTETINIECKSVYNATLDTDIVKASTTENTDTTSYNSWTTTVYMPTAPSTST